MLSLACLRLGGVDFLLGFEDRVSDQRSAHGKQRIDDEIEEKVGQNPGNRSRLAHRSFEFALHLVNRLGGKTPALFHSFNEACHDRTNHFAGNVSKQRQQEEVEDHGRKGRHTTRHDSEDHRIG